MNNLTKIIFAGLSGLPIVLGGCEKKELSGLVVEEKGRSIKDVDNSNTVNFEGAAYVIKIRADNNKEYVINVEGYLSDLETLAWAVEPNKTKVNIEEYGPSLGRVLKRGYGEIPIYLIKINK